MQAALIVAPAPFCGQLLRAGAALFRAAARLFAAKETSKAAAQDDVSEARKLISCHAIEDGECFCFAFESDFSVFLLRLLEQSFRIM